MPFHCGFSLNFWYLAFYNFLNCTFSFTNLPFVRQCLGTFGMSKQVPGEYLIIHEHRNDVKTVGRQQDMQYVWATLKARYSPRSSVWPAIMLAVTSTLCQLPFCLHEPLVTSQSGWSSGLCGGAGLLQGKTRFCTGGIHLTPNNFI